MFSYLEEQEEVQENPIQQDITLLFGEFDFVRNTKKPKTSFMLTQYEYNGGFCE